jgi:hypothetical protein
MHYHQHLACKNKYNDWFSQITWPSHQALWKGRSPVRCNLTERCAEAQALRGHPLMLDYRPRGVWVGNEGWFLTPTTRYVLAEGGSPVLAAPFKQICYDSDTYSCGHWREDLYPWFLYFSRWIL